MDDEEGGADAPRQGRRCREKEERNRYHVLT